MNAFLCGGSNVNPVDKQENSLQEGAEVGANEPPFPRLAARCA